MPWYQNFAKKIIYQLTLEAEASSVNTAVVKGI